MWLQMWLQTWLQVQRPGVQLDRREVSVAIGVARREECARLEP